ncbi:MAG TPA: DUF3288 family protein [Leptolyngbyaceae cyanobacterium]
MASDQKEQQHPQYRTDRQTVSQLLNSDPSDYNLVELGRMIIRYKGFPGAFDIQKDLEKTLQKWGLTEEALYTKTREIHQQGDVYKGLGRGREDWS